MADFPMPTYEELTRWRDAAERGDAASQCRLGGWFAVNAEASLALSVDEVWGHAVCWVRKAADQDHSGAQYILGAWYLEGDAGLEQDLTAATAWLRKAADQGISNAAVDLGTLYLRGNGVEQNLKQAVALFHRAAEEGSGTPRAKVTALDKLGECYSKGLGVKQDYKQAAAFFEKAAKLGYPASQYNLGVLYMVGRVGRPTDDSPSPRHAPH